MRRGAILAAAALLTCALVSCAERSSAASSSKASPRPTLEVSSASAANPAASLPPAAPTVSAPVNDLILVRSLGIDLTFSETSCSDPSLPTVVPSGETVLFADCGAYARFVGSITGPLRPLLTAPAGTPFEWTNAAGLPFTRALTGTQATVTRDQRSGQFPGHGVPPGSPPILIQLRNGTQQTELTAS